MHFLYTHYRGAGEGEDSRVARSAFFECREINTSTIRS